jgi:hypothetical protein
MPKRVIDGTALHRSEKIARVQPLSARPEFANILPLSLANGVFEASTERVWADVYSFNRPDVKPEHVETFLAAFEKVKLLFRWTDEAGKVWGYWIGIDKPGRLPGKSRRGRNEATGPEPPAEELRNFLNRGTDANGIQKLPGFGFGSGFGSGSGGKEGAPDDGAQKAQAAPRPSPSAFVCSHLVVSQKQDRLLGAAFPWIDREAEYRKADAWLDANPERRPRRTSRFLHNWFSRIPAPFEGVRGGHHGDERTRHIEKTDAAAQRFLDRVNGVAS